MTTVTAFPTTFGEALALAAAAPGYKPLKFRCSCDGRERGDAPVACFNHKHRPRIEVFNACFAGDLAFGDVDGLVEVNGQFLFLEWKAEVGPLPTGQWLWMNRLTPPERFTILCVAGPAGDMDHITALRMFRPGRPKPWHAATFADVYWRVSQWARMAEGHHPVHHWQRPPDLFRGPDTDWRRKP